MDEKYSTFPWHDPEEYGAVKLPSDLESVKLNLMEKYITPFGLPWLPGGVLKILVEAINLEGIDRANAILKASEASHVAYLSDVAKGRIKLKDETTTPMPEEVKQHLRELNQARRDEAKALREAREQRLAAFDEKKSPKAPKSGGPVFSDKLQQDALILKYPWIRLGSFRQDPEKAGGTLLAIICQSCGADREIHLADAFHCKFCKLCKGKKKNAPKSKLDRKP